MTDARRGELWLVDLGEPVANEQGWIRPGVVISADEWNRHASVVAVLPVTRTQYDLHTRVEIEPDATNGLDATSYARCEDIRTVSDKRLVHRIGRVDPVTMVKVRRALGYFLDA